MTDSPETSRPAAAAGQQWLAGKRLEAPIDEVLVMEDRAQVLRRARVTLAAGRQRLTCWPVTALVADSTLRCRCLGGGAEPDDAKMPRLLDLGVARRYLVRAARPETEREVRAALEQLADAYRDAYDEWRVTARRRHDCQRAAAGLVKHAAERLALGRFAPEWLEQIEQLQARRAELEQRLLALQWQQDERRERLTRLGQELEAAQQPVSDYQAGLFAELEVPRAGEYLLEWEYQVPCALWRPEYSAWLEEGESSAVEWESCGTVWQSSGEDWHQVELSFSTARPTLGAELPLLEDDLLAARPKTEHEKQVIEVSSRDQVIQRTSSAPEEQLSDTPPGLDDGGEARTYRVPGRVDVPSDGRPHRIAIERWRSEAAGGLVCLPEKARFVFLRSLQNNASALPLLAGPVALYRNNAYVGRSQVGFVAPGERFALSWGSEDELVVLRQAHREFSETGLRKHKRYEYTVKLYLANFAGKSRRLEVAERIPVSELEQVQVKLLERQTSADYRLDQQGVLRWTLELAPGEERNLELAFAVSMPAKVVWDA